MASGMIDHIEKKLKLQRLSVSYGGTISANNALRLTATEADYSIPSGYAPVGITYFNLGNANLALDYINLQAEGSTYFISVKNVTSSSVSSASATIDVLFAPEWMVETISADAPSKPSGDIMREPVFKIATFSCAYSSLASNSGKSFSRSDMGFFCPEGYEVFSLIRMDAGSYRVSLSDCDPFSPDRMLTIRNTYASAQTSTARLGVVFVNRKFMQEDTRNGLIIRYNKASKNAGDVDEGPILQTKEVWPSTEIQVTSGEPIFPQDSMRANVAMEFFIWRNNGQSLEPVIPTKRRVISGAEYLNFLNIYQFSITEDWTDKQIIIEYTFD